MLQGDSRREAKVGAVTNRKEISAKALLVLEVLKARAKEGVCEISQRDLARETDIPERTLRRKIRELQHAGLIEVRRRKRAPNLYRIVEGPHVADQGTRRPADLEDLHACILNGGHVLILGEEGMGKTHRLTEIQRNGIAASYDAVVLLQAGPPREFLVRLLSQLMEAGLAGPEEFTKPLRDYRVRELASLVHEILSRHRVLLLIDDLDRITPSVRPVISELLTEYGVQVVATATEERKVERFLDHFFIIRLQGLSRSETHALVERFVQYRGIRVRGGKRGMERLKEYIYSRTKGNPRKVQALLRKIEVQGYVDPRFMREELLVGGRTNFIDMTWVIVLAAALALAVRYLSLGLHDRLLYVLAGFTYAAFFVLRYFSWRWRRR
ncbi:hypothetical protein DRN52_05345 [Thermococci archaeon]|nr:MAG: hypothetical protein DRN52_05345 [Thermococci archaeon]